MPTNNNTPEIHVTPTDIKGNEVVRISRLNDQGQWEHCFSMFSDLKDYFGAGLEFIPENVANKATDLSSDDNTHYPTTQAVKTYVDTAVVGLLNDRGNYDASVNAFPSTGGSGTAGAILKGDLWYISVAGTLGGTNVLPGYSIRALVDSPGTTAANWDILNVGFGYVPENAANKDTDGTLAANSDTRYASQKATKTYVDTGLSGKLNTTDTTDAVTEGTTNKYFTTTRVLATALTGYAAAGSRVAVAATDTVLQAFGKVGKYLSDLATVAFTGSYSDLTGTPTALPPNGSAGGDLTGTYPNPTIKTNVALSGNPTTTTQTSGDNSTKIATTAYVDGGLSGKLNTTATTDAVTEGTTNKYFTTARVLATALTGYVAAGSRTAIAASDTVLQAFGKVGKYLSDLATVAFTGSYSDLTGTPTALPPNGSAGGDLTGTYPNPTVKTNIALGGNPTTTTQTSGDNSTKIATTAFVHTAVAAVSEGITYGSTVTSGHNHEVLFIDSSGDLASSSTFQFIPFGSVYASVNGGGSLNYQIGIDTGSFFLGASHVGPTTFTGVQGSTGVLKISNNDGTTQTDWLWPQLDTAGVLTSDGAGNLSWASGGTSSLMANYVGYGDSSNLLTGNGNFTYNDASTGGSFNLTIPDTAYYNSANIFLQHDTISLLVTNTMGPYSTGFVIEDGNPANGSSLKIYTGNSSLQNTWQWPNTDSAGVLTSDGAGNLSWGAGGGGGGGMVVAMEDVQGVSDYATNLLTYTLPSDGLNHTYRISAYLNVTTLGSDSVGLYVSYTDQNGNTVSNQPIYMVNVSSGSIQGWAYGTGYYQVIPLEIRCQAGCTITIDRDTTGGTIVFDAGAALELMELGSGGGGGGGTLIGQTSGVISSGTPVSGQQEVWLGDGAGAGGATTLGTVFIGASDSGLPGTGYGATGAYGSIFIGSALAAHNGTGYMATNAELAIFIGGQAGESATNASYSIFMGYGAGGSAANANNSMFIGIDAGNYASTANNSIFIGNSAGNSDTVNNSSSGTSILIGDNTSTGGFSNSIAIGKSATNTKANQFLLASSYRPTITLDAYADDSAAGTAGLTTGDLYQTNGSGAISTAGVLMIKQ